MRWPADKPPAQEVEKRVHYRANGEHKNYPSATGLWTFVQSKADKAKCAKLGESEWGILLETLRAALRASCVHQEFRGDFPARVWAFVNGTLHEARLSNQSTGEYHGFPLEYGEQWPDDPEGLLRNAPRVAISVH